MAIEKLSTARPAVRPEVLTPLEIIHISDGIAELQRRITIGGEIPREEDWDLLRAALAVAHEHAAHTTEELTASRKREKGLAKRAREDVVTGMYNRAYFDEELRRLWSRDNLLYAGSRTQGLRQQGGEQESEKRQPLSMLYIDLVGFKAVNDQAGHQEGDLVLQSIARRLTEHLSGERTAGMTLQRASDFPARIGGDEFGVLLPNTDESGGFQVARRIVAMVESVAGELGFKLSARVGVAQLGTEMSPEDLVNEADFAQNMLRNMGEVDERAAGVVVEGAKRIMTASHARSIVLKGK